MGRRLRGGGLLPASPSTRAVRGQGLLLLLGLGSLLEVSVENPRVALRVETIAEHMRIKDL
jgi:hypothetical protein